MHFIPRMARHLNRKSGLILLTVGLIAALFAAVSAMAREGETDTQGRADIITLDDLKNFGVLERPPVVFLHDKHVEFAAKQNKDCLSCHPMGERHMSLKYQRQENTDQQQVTDIYHSTCVACHEENIALGKPAGPVTCGECHAQEITYQLDWKPIGMDRSLHYQHVKANDNKCELCHHQYNAQTKTLYYAKGQEEACIYCHKEQTEENRISIRLASHASCVECHRQRLSENRKAGPVTCGGCHSPAQQALIEKIPNPPRIERNQPDVTLVKTHRRGEPAIEGQLRMALVPFNHKAHEGYTEYCKTCHHSSLASCAQCHTLNGNADGRQIKLAQSMHQQDAPMSCVGCHNIRKTQPACAGCHDSMPNASVWASEASCKVCHVPTAVPRPRSGDENQVKAMAAELIALRPTEQQMVAVQDIPETVKIERLVDQYEAVAMPHRAIVLKLAELTRKDRLATAFHTEPTTLCQGCHHHSPPSLKPPQCGSCHGQASDALNPTRLGLRAAYHEQCFQCHEQMGIQKPASRDCLACHAKRAPSENKS